MYEVYSDPCTVTKPKELRRVTKRMLALAKKGDTDIYASRQAHSYNRTKDTVAKQISERGPRYMERSGEGSK